MGIPAYVAAIRFTNVGGVQPCVGIVKGVNTASRLGSTGFAIELNLVYLSNKQFVTVSDTTLIAQTNDLGKSTDNKTALVDYIIDKLPDGTPVPPPDDPLSGNVTATVRVVHRNELTRDLEEVLEPSTSYLFFST